MAGALWGSLETLARRWRIACEHDCVLCGTLDRVAAFLPQHVNDHRALASVMSHGQGGGPLEQQGVLAVDSTARRDLSTPQPPLSRRLDRLG